MPKAKQTIAWCWASGLIEFGDKLPEGCIQIATGPDEALRERVAVVARQSYRTNKLLVPGVPESKDQEAAADALADFLYWVRKTEKPGSQITWATEA